MYVYIAPGRYKHAAFKHDAVIRLVFLDDIHAVIQVCDKVIIAAGVFNVWVLRSKKPTPYRGGEAGNMADEFKHYGLPEWMMKLTGAAKLLLGALLIVGIWVPRVAAPAAAVMALLMIGAILMHVRVKDPAIKSLPAFLMLAMSVVVLVAYT